MGWWGGCRGGGVECSIFQNIDDGPIKWLPSGKRKKTMLAAEPKNSPGNRRLFDAPCPDGRPWPVHTYIGNRVVWVVIQEEPQVRSSGYFVPFSQWLPARPPSANPSTKTGVGVFFERTIRTSGYNIIPFSNDTPDTRRRVWKNRG